MASGDPIASLQPADNVPLSTDFATLDLVPAGTGFIEVLDFAGSGNDESAIFQFKWPGSYDNLGVDITIGASTDGTSTGTVRYQVSIGTLSDGDAKGSFVFGSAVNIDITPTGAADVYKLSATASITHANCGSPARGDTGRVLVTRDVSAFANTDDAQWTDMVLSET